MDLEIGAFEKIDTWSIIELPLGKEALGCKWVFTISIMQIEVLKDIKHSWLQNDIHNKQG